MMCGLNMVDWCFYGFNVRFWSIGVLVNFVLVRCGFWIDYDRKFVRSGFG